jgi:hypothetical protein
MNFHTAGYAAGDMRHKHHLDAIALNKHESDL